MAKQKLKDVKEEVKKQDEEFYGDVSLGSGSPDPETDDDTEEALEKVVGGDIDPEKPFSIADEVENDEKGR